MIVHRFAVGGVRAQMGESVLVEAVEVVRRIVDVVGHGQDGGIGIGIGDDPHVTGSQGSLKVRTEAQGEGAVVVALDLDAAEVDVSVGVVVDLDGLVLAGLVAISNPSTLPNSPKVVVGDFAMDISIRNDLPKPDFRILRPVTLIPGFRRDAHAGWLTDGSREGHDGRRQFYYYLN